MLIIRTNYRHYEHTDFSYLLSNKETTDTIKDKKSDKTPSVYISPKERKIDCEEIFLNTPNEYKISKADKLANPLLKYIYSNVTHIYHDKSCPFAQKIPDKSFETTMHFSDDYNWCPDCYKAAMIRYGIDGDSKLFERYLEYFSLVKAKKDTLHFLIIEKQAKLRLVSNTVMEFEINDDRWRISKRNRQLILLHNNYYIDKTGKRVFEKTFHIQVENALSFKSCAHYMADYTWAGHLAGMEKKRIQREEKKKHDALLFETSNNAFIESFLYIKNHYLFSDKYIYLDCEDYVADFYLTKYNVKIKFLAEYIIPNSKYRWIICKVPKNQFSRFSLSMRRTSHSMFARGYYEFYDILKTFINIK